MNLNHIVRIEEMIQELTQIRTHSHSNTLILAFEDLHKIPRELYPQIFNVLDGVYDVTDCLIVMTTNVPFQELDPTLSRCGRVNYIIEFNHMTFEMKKKMFMSLVPHFHEVMDELHVKNSRDQDGSCHFGSISLTICVRNYTRIYDQEY